MRSIMQACNRAYSKQPLVSGMQDHDEDLWRAITETYDRARVKGVAYKTDTNVQRLEDPTYHIQFVLRVAAALRDKPKPPKDRQVRCITHPAVTLS